MAHLTAHLNLQSATKNGDDLEGGGVDHSKRWKHRLHSLVCRKWVSRTSLSFLLHFDYSKYFFVHLTIQLICVLILWFPSPSLFLSIANMNNSKRTLVHTTLPTRLMPTVSRRPREANSFLHEAWTPSF